MQTGDILDSLSDSFEPSWCEHQACVDHTLKTAVHLAAEKGNLACLQLLLKYVCVLVYFTVQGSIELVEVACSSYGNCQNSSYGNCHTVETLKTVYFSWITGLLYQQLMH